jgi:hypothetical protein
MHNFIKSLFIIIFLSISGIAVGQSQITFQVDFKQQMKDSVFVPSQHSVVVTGNQLPFTSLNSFRMQDTEPVDSVYSAQVRFPSSEIGKTLKFNFEIKRPKKENLTERQPRLLRIEEGSNTLRPDYFNSFAR